MVVGLPLTLAGGDSAQTRETREFAHGARSAGSTVPVELYDERFTTRLAERNGGRAERGLAGGGVPARGMAARACRPRRRRERGP